MSRPHRHQLQRSAAAAALATVLWFAPVPAGVDPRAWQVFAVFAGCILSFLVHGLPSAVVVLLGLSVLAATGTLKVDEVLAGYGDKTVWLVVAAFLLAGAVQRTGLGRRIALLLVDRLGHSATGLGYAICAAELLLGPVVPSNTARGGGILAPIVDALARALGSTPERAPERAGAYLSLVGAHANLIAAAMFLTGMAANPLVAEAAESVLGVQLGWGTWALGALVPGLASMALLPLVLARLAPPGAADVGAARREARAQLAELGPWTGGERALMAVFALLLALWSSKGLHGLDATLVALLGLGVLLLSGTQAWRDFAEEAAAWDAMVWLGGLLTMADALKELGLVGWLADRAGAAVAGLPLLPTLLALALIYFYTMYGFSMLTGHIAAMVAAFLAVMKAAGASATDTGLVAAALLGYFSNLCGCLTHYSSGPIIIYHGLGYVAVPRWFRIGFAISLLHLLVWLGLGLPWWKLLGWW
jgi:DASS family divalent anion:Na+ symporter